MLVMDLTALADPKLIEKDLTPGLSLLELIVMAFTETTLDAYFSVDPAYNLIYTWAEYSA